MKKFKFVKIVLVIAFALVCGFVALSQNAKGETGKTEMVLFFNPGCPHCHHAMEFLQKIAPKYPDLVVTKYNTSTKVGVNYYFHYAKKLGLDNAGAVPLAVFGDKYELGFGGENSTGKKYIEHIEEMLKSSK